ncbi:MAG: hypothetical protein GX361_08365 [Bacteroidales bacterium]|nr:hypothetical protein [Bacteroidales bacterium]
MILHITIHTNKAKESVDFYQWLLNLPIAQKLETPNGDIVFLGCNETKLEIISDTNAETIHAPSLSIGFAVDNLEEKIKMLENQNIACSAIISPSPDVKFAFFTDLNGCKIQLCEQIK